mgnify:CR=1 FL=1
MININDINGASVLLLDLHKWILKEFKENIIGVEMGIAYGGGVESIGKVWGDNGIIYGFDTFEGHPKQVALKDPTCEFSMTSKTATCLDAVYNSFGMGGLSLESIQKELDRQNLNNVKLIKGLIDETTTIDYIPYIHYAFLDLDFPLSMQHAYALVEKKLVKGGYLCLHDVLPIAPGLGLPGLSDWYKTVLQSGNYKIIKEDYSSFLSILKKI